MIAPDCPPAPLPFFVAVLAAVVGLVTFAAAWANAPTCNLSANAAIAPYQSAYGTASSTFTFTLGTGDTLGYHCVGYR